MLATKNMQAFHLTRYILLQVSIYPEKFGLSMHHRRYLACCSRHLFDLAPALWNVCHRNRNPAGLFAD